MEMTAANFKVDANQTLTIARYAMWRIKVVVANKNKNTITERTYDMSDNCAMDYAMQLAVVLHGESRPFRVKPGEPTTLPNASNSEIHELYALMMQVAGY